MTWVRRRGRFAVPERRVFTERFWWYVKKRGKNDCWRWTGAMSGRERNYGVMLWLDRKMHHASRIAYEIANGTIPERLTIDHLCGHPWCVNPKHLEAVTVYENDRRRRTTRFWTWRGRTQSVSEWARERKLSVTTLWGRVMRSRWTLEEALTLPGGREQMRRKVPTETGRRGLRELICAGMRE